MQSFPGVEYFDAVCAVSLRAFVQLVVCCSPVCVLGFCS